MNGSSRTGFAFAPGECDALARYLHELLSPEAAAPPLAPEAVAENEIGPIPCRLLEACGVMLAIPTAHTRPIAPVPWRPAAAEAPEWLAGFGEYRGRRIAVVDLAALIHEGGRIPCPDREAATLLLLAGDTVALRPQRLLATAALDPKRIRWRTPHTRRPWLRGVCADPPCAVLDAHALAAMVPAGMDSAT